MPGERDPLRSYLLLLQKASFWKDDGGLLFLQQESPAPWTFKPGVIPCLRASVWPLLLTTAKSLACPLGWWYPEFWVDLCEQPRYHSLHYVSTFFSFWETGRTLMCGGIWKDDKRHDRISLVWGWRAEFLFALTPTRHLSLGPKF